MGLTRAAIEAMAPDQSALSAAAGLLKPAKWPLRARAGHLIWGECQGSGANPYRVVADTEEHGSKCTCPSRKFPCKHALALMWVFVEEGAAFAEGETPAWVTEWMGRRRKGSAPAQASAEPKSLAAATQQGPPKQVDPEAEARRQAAALKRAQDTSRLVRTATEDLEIWIADQLRTGLSGFVGEVSERCRRIAARLVDAKAGALAGRIDEMPARILALPADERLDAVIVELGKLVLLARAWRATPDDPELRREVIASETREDVVGDPGALHVNAVWEVIGERIVTRRDGLVSQSTWFLNLDDGPQRFALLLDFFPASAGRRTGTFVVGDRIRAELAFYPAKAPLRAVMVTRTDAPDTSNRTWPQAADDPLAEHAHALLLTPWRMETPLLLPEGRIGVDKAGRAWWRSGGGASTVPLNAPPPALAYGAGLSGGIGLWNGARLTMLAATTDWGRLAFDA